MNRHKRAVFCLFALAVAAVFALSALGCGGGGSAGAQAGDSGQGTVALYLTDGPTDEFDHIWIELSEILLIPSDDSRPQVVFQTDDPQPIDLLALRDGVAQLLCVDPEVPAGSYSKIRLEVNAIAGEKEGRTITFNLPSGKIDLNPDQEIIVDEDQTLSIELDIDAEKSIHIAGPNYNFRPVVFVDVNPMSHPITSRHMFSGEIEALIYDEAQPEVVAGFSLNLFHGIHTVDVMLQQEVVIFNDQGEPVGPEALEAGQLVQLTGELDSNGQFLADRVVIGPIATVFGMVESVVETDQFELTAFGCSMDMEERGITVALSSDTLILIDGVEVGPEQIQPGQKACIAGKVNEETGVLQAIAIFLKAPQIVGTLTAIEPADAGSQLTIVQGEQATTVVLPADVIPTLNGGAELTLEALSALVACDPPLVAVTVDRLPAEEDAPRAIALEVLPQIIDVEVAQVDSETGVITTTEGQTIAVPEDALLMRHTGLEQEAHTLADLQEGDQLWVAAVKQCGDTDYQAILVIKVAPFEMPCMPHLERIEMTVAQVDGNTITAVDENVAVTVTEETLFIDHTQRPVEEITLEDIAADDILICEVLIPCEEASGEQGPAEAIVIIRIDPEDGSTPGPPEHCMPEAAPMEVIVKSVADGAITTTGDETILVPEETPIVTETESGMEELTLADIQADDQLKAFVVRSCEDDTLTAVWIVNLGPIQ